MSAGTSAVRFDHVSKSFGTRKVLDDISLEIPAGQAFCLLGRSGTGKSVTLRHIVGLVQPDSGNVFVEGEDITTLAGRELAGVRKRMGFLFQNAALFDSMSVGDNVAFPMRRHTKWTGAEIRERAQAKLADCRSRQGFRHHAERPLGRHEETGRARPRDGPRPCDPARRRAERRPGSDHGPRDRRAARSYETGWYRRSWWSRTTSRARVSSGMGSPCSRMAGCS